MGWMADDDTTLQEYGREMYKAEDAAAYNWQKRHNAYREMRGNITDNGCMSFRSPTRLRGRPTLAPLATAAVDSARETFRVGISDSADKVCHAQLHGRFPKFPPQPHMVGSAELWPKRILKQQNVIEWRSYMNTTGANNGMRDGFRTSQSTAYTSANYGSHWAAPSGKVVHYPEPDHANQQYKAQRRCYRNVEQPVHVHKNAFKTISLKQSMAQTDLMYTNHVSGSNDNHLSEAGAAALRNMGALRATC